MDQETTFSTRSTAQRIDAMVTPAGSLEILSKREVASLRDTSDRGLYDLYRRCSLATLNSGSEVDDARRVMDYYRDFDIQIVQQERGIKLDLKRAPARAFVDGKIIKGIQEHLFAVLRDVLYVNYEVERSGKFDLEDSSDITDAVFHILRNSGSLRPSTTLDLIVCWGGHSIGRKEYSYTKEVGYEFGLRSLNVITGCGPGAMKGPMKGATIGHAKQRNQRGRYIGITEPGIIAAESPNPIVNDLVIMPDIEKRLEAFVRLGHGIVVFPGGVGTAEEILYILGIKLHPDNAGMPLPLVFTGPADSREYFQRLDKFIGATLGPDAQRLYEIIIDDPAEVARTMGEGCNKVKQFRSAGNDAYYFNWLLTIERGFQMPFEPTHENMADLYLGRDQSKHDLAANLRRAFSGIVAGNVKEPGVRAIEAHGPFNLTGDAAIMDEMDTLLNAFVAQRRMKIDADTYTPCYRLKR